MTRRRAQRHAQAERIKGLHQVGEDAVRHAGELPTLRERVLGGQAKIAELHAANQADIARWTAGLADIAARGHALQPEPVPPSGRPHATSAHVWAGTVDTRPLVNVHGRMISGINPEDPDGFEHALEAADRQTAQHDPALRLVRAPSGVVTPFPADPYGHWQRRVDSGELVELSPRERRDYFNGGGAA